MKAVSLVLVPFLFLLGFSSSKAQKSPKNHIFVEVGGATAFVSTNYERFIYQEKLSLRFGYGFLPERNAALHGSANYYFPTKSKSRFWQIGLGTTFSNTKLHDFVGNQEFEPSYLYFIPSIGHRWRSKKNYTLQLSINTFVRENEMVPWGGLGIGKQF